MGDYFLHETSCIDEGAVIGKGTKIWHFSHVLSGAQIGENCIIGQNVCVTGKARIGSRCKIQNNISVYDNVILEDEVYLDTTQISLLRLEIQKKLGCSSLDLHIEFDDEGQRKLTPSPNPEYTKGDQ